MHNLEKGKIYILGVAGSGMFSRLIQAASENKLEQTKRWSHVAVCFWHWSLNQWVVIESIYPFGVRLVTLTFWLYENWKKPIVQAFAYPHLKPSELFQYLGQPYGKMDIARLARQKFTSIKAHTKDYEGIYCAELLALCDNGNLSAIIGLNSFVVVPSDIQEMGIKDYEVFEFRDLFVDNSLPIAA